MKIYELKNSIYSKKYSSYDKNAEGIYKANKDLINKIIKGENVIFKYKESYFKIEKNMRIEPYCDFCEFRDIDNELFCENVGLCIQHYIYTLKNNKNEFLCSGIKKIEEYEAIFMEE